LTHPAHKTVDPDWPKTVQEFLASCGTKLRILTQVQQKYSENNEAVVKWRDKNAGALYAVASYSYVANRTSLFSYSCA
jgi:hypothetical protein